MSPLVFGFQRRERIINSIFNSILQRYRTLKWLPYKRIDQKTYYLESDVEKFIKDRFEKNTTFEG